MMLISGERRDLKSTLRALAQYGYTCFWQGDKGSLAAASGASWCDAFEFRAHSNLVCAHDAQILAAMRQVALAGAAQRR